MSHKINDGLTKAQRYRKLHPERSRAAVAKYRLLHLEQNRESNRKSSLIYAAEHREQERLRAAQWRKDNPEKARESGRKNYLKSKVAVKERHKIYREENREAVGLWQRNRKAKKRAGDGKVTRKFILSLFVNQGGRCLVCKSDFADTGYDIDHVIPISKGGEHSPENVQLLCPTCNKRKSARTMNKFVKIMEAEYAKL